MRTKLLVIGLLLLGAYLLIFHIEFLCSRLPNKLGCFEGNLKFRTDFISLDNGKKYLAGLNDDKYLTFGECHTLAHQLGHWAVDKGIGMVEAMEQGSAFCGWGFFHGVLEGLFGEGGGHGKISVEDAFKTCDKINKDDRLRVFNCFHALGHGFFAVDENLKNSLNRCDISAAALTQGFCYDGVFMAQTFSEAEEAPDKLKKTENLLSVCGNLAGKSRLYCYWRYVPIDVFTDEMVLPSEDIINSVSIKIPNEMRPIFWNGFGRELESRFAGDENIITKTCNWAGDYRIDCVEGAAMHMLFFDLGGTSRPDKLCRRALSDKYVDTCVSDINASLYPGPFSN